MLCIILDIVQHKISPRKRVGSMETTLRRSAAAQERHNIEKRACPMNVQKYVCYLLLPPNTTYPQSSSRAIATDSGMLISSMIFLLCDIALFANSLATGLSVQRCLNSLTFINSPIHGRPLGSCTLSIV